MAESILNPAVITLTPRAIEEVRAMQGKPDNVGKPLRVYVEQGGCSGMQYGLVFDELREGDEVAGAEGVQVVVDAFSAQYLRGCTVDFSDSLTSGGFKMANPNAGESCGCGKSFKT
jgi:iron-sulfur cluster assembly protein/iron-sulfur cluster insertion protein